MADIIVNARFRGDGYRPDMPARDMDLAELDLLTPEQRDLLAHLDGLYELTWGSDGETEAAAPAAAADNLEGLRKPELIALALSRGLDDSGTVAELKARIAAAPGETEAAAPAAAADSATDADGQAAGEEGTPA